MTSDEFKKDDGLVKAWRAIQEDDTYKMVVEIARNESPILQKPEDTDTGALVHYGKILGYADYAQKLNDLGQYTQVQSHPKRNYARRTADNS